MANIDINELIAKVNSVTAEIKKSCSLEKAEDELEENEQVPVDQVPVEQAPEAPEAPVEQAPVEQAPEAPVEQAADPVLQQVGELIGQLDKQQLAQISEMIMAKMNEPDLSEIAKSMKTMSDEIARLKAELNKSKTQEPTKVVVEPSRTVENTEINKSGAQTKKYKTLGKQELINTLKKSRAILGIPGNILRDIQDSPDNEFALSRVYENASKKGITLPERS